ncbi:hypothetical protein [Tolypothrix sp. VBCCA 56010]|uniref:hypothetical protein n=1 Tax=Tolypothrix sp. VBCCA 56010 TaxID=3137731 RepID=UPI003D7EE850
MYSINYKLKKERRRCIGEAVADKRGFRRLTRMRDRSFKSLDSENWCGFGKTE